MRLYSKTSVIRKPAYKKTVIRALAPSYPTGLTHSHPIYSQHITSSSQLGYSFEKDLDGTVTGSYTTAAGLTLEQCKSKCADGTWSGCVGFSRYSASSDTAAASCWWVANVGELSYDDGNNDENMYKLTTRGIGISYMPHFVITEPSLCFFQRPGI